MKLLDTLQEEHALIERMLGSFRTYVDGLANGTADPGDGRQYVAFFTDFAGHFHHDREEAVFFEALVSHAELPGDRGPIHALTHEHAEMAEWLREMTPLVESRPESDADRARLRDLVTRYSHALWRHIDAENSVMFPQGEERLRWRGIRELPDRPMTREEAAARDAAETVLARYPPNEDQSLIRGDGCIMCRSYLETCNGLEAEWWTEIEWEESNRDGGD